MSYYYSPPQNEYYQEDPVLKNMVLEKLYTGLLLATALSVLVIVSNTSPLLIIIAVVVEIIAIIGYFFAKKESTIETLYYMFVSSSAVLLGFTLEGVLAVLSNGLQIISYTAGSTALIVGYTYYRASNTQVNLDSLARRMMPFSIAFIVIIIAGIFISFGGLIYLLISIFGAILFSFYLFYDLGRLMQRQFVSPAKMAWSLYWDILLIFRFILNIMIALLGND